MRPNEMEQALRELQDREDIKEILHRYCTDVDMNRPSAVAGLFTNDCVVDFGPGMGRFEGRARLERALRKGLGTVFTATSHHISNIQVFFEGDDSARTTSYLYAWHAYPGDQPDGYLWGRYFDQLVRKGDGWQIADHRLVVAGARGFQAEVTPIGRLESDS